jgi:hypothetical protein
MRTNRTSNIEHRTSNAERIPGGMDSAFDVGRWMLNVGCFGSSRHSSRVTRHPQNGVALIVTLILLSVVTFMAITYLAISRRERGAVTTTAETATARLAADAALAGAEAQVVANIYATGNPYNFGLLVSTNYINGYGFDPGFLNPTNVNYNYTSAGNPLTADQMQTNIANLFYSPRAPVFVANRLTGTNELRFYLDLNRNGRYDTNGWVTNVDNNLNGLGTTSFQVGDPEWIGVLERPDTPHGPNNRFVARFAFIAVPIGNALDLNAIHNQVFEEQNANPTVNPAANSSANVGFDFFFRNQGVGSWEINLAAFLADLNTNQWGQVVGLSGATWYQYNQPGSANSGRAFDDARALLAYRYNNNYGTLASVDNLFGGSLGPGHFAFINDNIDGYSDGPLQITLNTNEFFNQDVPARLWAGADNTNHFFTHQELFDPAKTQIGVVSPALGFTDHLLAAGTNVSTYDRYTFYRLLSQLGTDSAPEADKININYANAVVYTNNYGVATNIAIVPGAETNFVPWTPVQFFTVAADRMLRLYTTNWFRENASNFLVTCYGITGITNTSELGLTNFPLYGMTNTVPAFGVANIPVWVNNQFVYSSAINRLLQLAANIYDATTTNFYPSVFRPIFEHDGSNNVFIVGYANLYSDFGTNTVSSLTDLQLAPPYEITQLPSLSASFTPIIVNGYYVNVYGVPWIIGAKKGFPNFNEFTMQNVVQVQRKLQVTRQTVTGPITTNQMYIFSISNFLGAELWNSYNSNYVSLNSIQGLVRDNVWMVLTSDALGFTKPQIINGGFTNTFSIAALTPWPGSGPWTLDGKPLTNSFLLPLNPAVSAVVLLTNAVYDYGSGAVPGYAPPCFIPQFLDPSNFLDTGISQLPHFGLLTTNRLQLVIIDGIHVIDYVHFNGPNSSRDLNAELRDPYSVGDPAYMWSTNAYVSSSKPYGVVNQINVSRGLAALPSNAGGTWDHTYEDLEIPFFDAFFFKGNAKHLSPPVNGVTTVVNTNLSQQVPFTPMRIIFEYISWQANDPLVHYVASDLNYIGGDTTPPTGTNQCNTSLYPTPTFGILNERYQPWGRVHVYPNSDANAYNTSYRDPLVWQSDNWDFPTNKFPAAGWLGRVHRGTPWQTVYLKATNILNLAQALPTRADGLITWENWTGDLNLFDAYNAAPAQDQLLFDVFTTAFNDNATRGTLSVNQNHLAAWSALFSGIVVPPTTLTNFYTVINPAGPSGAPVPVGPPGLNSPLGLGYLVQNGTNGINDIRARMPGGVFKHVGDILAVPALTDRSPFLNLANTSYNNDEMYEWLPQQVMSLLRVSSTPRYVIYCYGQGLKPAPNSFVTGGPLFGMCTNYQVVSEIATRAVVRVNSHVAAAINNSGQPITTTNYSAVIENFNVLPPD